MMRLPRSFEFECPVKTHYGLRALEHLPFELRAMNAAKPLVISDAAAAQDRRLASVLKAFRNADMTLGVVEAIPDADPQLVVPQLAAIYRDKDCDAIVAVGQGRTIDTAKWLNLVMSTGEERFDAFSTGQAIPKRRKPLAVVPPATADGFETSGYLRSGQATIRSVHLMPQLLFLDPRTAGRPDVPALAESALVALTHGAECFFRDANPMTAVYARTAAGLAIEVLHQLAHRGRSVDDLALNTSHAAALGGCALGAGPLAATHRLGNAVAASGKCSSAQAMGIILSYALEHRAVNGRLASDELLELLGGPDRFARTPDGQRGPAAFYFLRNLLNLLFDRTTGRLKRTLQDAGLSPEELQVAVARAGEDGEGEGLEDAAVILAHAREGRPFLTIA